MAKVFYYGKYRAMVQDVSDPEQRGRIRVLCPKVLGESVSNWCEPCIPVAYDFNGDFAVPKVGETVWIEFEEGNVNNPILVGGWWKSNSTPSNPYNVSERYIKWDDCVIKMDKKKNLIEITAKEKIEIKVGDTGGSSKILITKDSIKLESKKIDLN